MLHTPYARQSEILNLCSLYTTLQDSTRLVGAESFDQRLFCRGMLNDVM